MSDYLAKNKLFNEERSMAKMLIIIGRDNGIVFRGIKASLIKINNELKSIEDSIPWSSADVKKYLNG